MGSHCQLEQAYSQFDPARSLIEVAYARFHVDYDGFLMCLGGEPHGPKAAAWALGPVGPLWTISQILETLFSKSWATQATGRSEPWAQSEKQGPKSEK